MNTESKTLSIGECQDTQGIKRITTCISLRTEVFDYLDKCFQLIDYSWNEFIQEQIEEAIESLGTQASSWLGEMIQDKLKEK